MLRFYKCKHCGNIVVLLTTKKGDLVCCDEKMQELVANTEDAAREKHVPVVEVSGSHVKVTVGDVIHPMTEAHLITWILIETNKGHQIKHLTHTDEPVAEFILAEGEELLAAYEYCNLHSLWKKQIRN